MSDAQARGERWTKGKWFAAIFLAVLIGQLMAVALGLSIVVLAMLTMLTLMIMMIFMFAVWGGLKLVFILIPGWIAKR